MAGKLTEQAYLKALDAGAKDAEDAQRWMLVFDRMARGLRLTMALEARLARERRWDARELRSGEMTPEAQGERDAPRWRRPAATGAADHDPRECDRERDDGGLPETAPLSQRIARLAAIIEGADDAPPPARPVRYRFEAAADAPTGTPTGTPAPQEQAAAAPPPWRSSA